MDLETGARATSAVVETEAVAAHFPNDACRKAILLDLLSYLSCPLV
ncbi:hypothetical protein MtrunA17_Chr4g0067901 [Medicago truncatula]|uniref:Uncharacterized protein n=1 Tax=Medicago truncatula TaxID=3880 RepID=A0A396IFF8_MEDTR|nr:hypothetical protein MtrunA17_Chr4g0067901 [Medicago truncatula]